MSIQLKLIPIYIEDQRLISVDDNWSEDNIHEIKFINNDELDDEIEELKKVDFGERTVVNTNVKDKSMLIESIHHYAQRFKDSSQIRDFIAKGSLNIVETDYGTYNLVFQGYFSKEEIDYISDTIIGDYKYDVQEETYKKVLEKIKENNYMIESEDVTSDDSIVLTVNI